MKTKLFNMRCEDEEHARWVAFAHERGKTLAGVIREYLNLVTEKAKDG